jgi:hypothetical protein
LRRELDSKLIINENGKRKVITKSEGVVKQLLNKSLSGHHPSTRLLIPLYQQELEKAAEQERIYQNNLNRKADDLTDAELLYYIIAELRKTHSAERMAEMIAMLVPKLTLAEAEKLRLPVNDPK